MIRKKSVFEKKHWGLLFPLSSIVFYVFASVFLQFTTVIVFTLMILVISGILGAVWYLHYADPNNTTPVRPDTRGTSGTARRLEYIPVRLDRVKDVWHRLFIALPGSAIYSASGAPLEGVYFVQLREVFPALALLPISNESHKELKDLEEKQDEQKTKTGVDAKMITCPHCGSKIRPMRLINGDILCPVCFTRLNLDEKAPSPKIIQQLAREIAKKHKN